MANIVDLMGQPFTAPQPRQPEPPEAQFKSAMLEVGITPPDYIDADGQLHRFSTNGKSGDKAGWYILYGGRVPAGSFGDWRAGSSVPFRADIGRDLTAAESIEHARQVAEMRALRERELAEKRADAAETAAGIWESASQASDDHPYLVRKQISANGLKVAGDGRLIAPLLIDGEIVSLQYIAADGQKLFMKGGRTSGASWLIGGHDGAATYYVAEGVATGLTIFEATGQPVAIAYSAGNMAATAKSLREWVGSTARIVIVADNDRSGTGQAEGQKAAEAIGAALVIPPEAGQDINDYAIAGGDIEALLNPKPQDGYLVAADDFCRDPAPIRWLIKRHLQRDALIMIHGPSGGGKTFVVLDMVLSMASGKAEWCGFKVAPGPVVYLAGEGHHGLRARLAAWKQHHGAGALDMWLSKAGEDLNTPGGYLRVRDAMMALPRPPAAIVVDTLHRFLSGDENSAQDAKTMLDACSGLMAEFGCSVVLVHHTGVSDEAQHRARGSSAWRGALDIEISIVPGKDGAPLEVIQRKSKDAELAEPIYMKITPVPLPWQDEDGEPVTSAIVVQVDAPEGKQESTSTVPAGARQLFESAWFALGDIDQGRPYLTASAWNEYTKSRDYPTDGARRKSLQRAKQDLMETGYLEEYKAGYIVADSMAAIVLAISRHTK